MAALSLRLAAARSGREGHRTVSSERSIPPNLFKQPRALHCCDEVGP